MKNDNVLLGVERIQGGSGKRFYVLGVISHTTREIVRLAITENPTREFFRQQLMLFSESMASTVYVIHDNARMFNAIQLAQQ